MAKKIPGIPPHIENYLLSLLFHMTLPLFPLVLEYWQNGGVKTETLTLLAALYSISIGVSSRSKIIFGLSVIISIVFSVAFGLSSGGTSVLVNSEFYAATSIVCIFIMHAGERWNIHVVAREPYWSFD
jgi:hypothetical protein